MTALAALPSTARLAGCLVLAALLLVGSACQASERIYRVAVIAHSPPLSYTDESGKLTGFNIEVAHELCATLQIRCQLQPMPIESIVDSVAADDSAFAVVGFIPTPERQQRVLFSKTYFHSRSVWLAKPDVALGKSQKPVAVDQGEILRIAEHVVCGPPLRSGVFVITHDRPSLSFWRRTVGKPSFRPLAYTGGIKQA